jgi:hypothetical protein
MQSMRAELKAPVAHKGVSLAARRKVVTAPTSAQETNSAGPHAVADTADHWQSDSFFRAGSALRGAQSLRRQGLCQRCAQEGGRKGRCQMGGEGEGAACARQGRAHLPRHEMPVRLPQSALPRHRQERRTGVRAAGTRQPVPRTQQACVRMTPAGAKRPTRDRRGGKTSFRNARLNAPDNRKTALLRGSLTSPATIIKTMARIPQSPDH